MFIGKYNNSIDDKSRLIVPSKYRKELDEQCIIAKGLDKCLWIYSPQEWDELMGKLKSLPVLNKNARYILRKFAAEASDCGIDKQGRVTISQDLKDYAGISKDVVTVGAVTRIEIWSAEEWEASQAALMSSPEELEAAMEQFGI